MLFILMFLKKSVKLLFTETYQIAFSSPPHKASLYSFFTSMLVQQPFYFFFYFKNIKILHSQYSLEHLRDNMGLSEFPNS